MRTALLNVNLAVEFHAPVDGGIHETLDYNEKIQKSGNQTNIALFGKWPSTERQE